MTGCPWNQQGNNYEMANQAQKPTCQCMMPFTNVINRYFYQDVPVPVQYHTKIVNNCIKRYYPAPYNTCSEETVYVDEPYCGCQSGCQNR